MAKAEPKDAGRIYVRASNDDRRVFQALANRLGLGEISNTIRLVMFEKARELGLTEAEPRKGNR